MQMASRVKNLGTEQAFEVLEEVNSLRDQGKNIISLAIGEPDFNTPEEIKKAGIEAIKNNKTGYSPSPGIPVLRQEVANYLSQTRGAKYNPEETVVAPGAKPLIFYGIMALMERGDKVIYPNPGFPVYNSIIEMIGGEAVPLPLRAENSFNYSPEELRDIIDDETTGIIINSPQNPTGAVIDSNRMAELAGIIREENLWVISDEVYSEMVYDEKASSIVDYPGMKERTLLIDGFSKTFAMTGWRIGYAGGPQELSARIGKLITNSVSCTATFTQHAAAEALKSVEKYRQNMVSELKERRDLIFKGLNDIRGISCQKPKGAFYAYADVTKACEILQLADAAEFQKFLLHKAGVAVLYRECFGDRFPGENREYIRLSFANNQKNISRALTRIKNRGGLNREIV